MDENKKLKEALKKERKHSENILRACGIFLIIFGIGTALCGYFLPVPYTVIWGFIMIVFGAARLVESFK